MAKITNPLHSITATGTVAGQVTFRRSGGRAVALHTPRASASRTPAQDARRILYAEGCAAWRSLTVGQQNDWRAIGAHLAISGFNAFMSDHLQTLPIVGIPWDNGASIWDSGASIWS